ncbi:MAG: peroxide stress protein YaaA [Rickettsiales bacterium]|nr:peroxide stress protein YaaA [Rickettsiales bacterium]
MLLVISPAKSLDLTTTFNLQSYSTPEFDNDVKKITKNLSKLKASDFETLMKISPKLAELNFKRYQDFNDEFNAGNSRQALLAFDGDVYQGIDKQNYDEDDFAFAQKTLRILSGLYGLLKPLDLIQPYRLEMGTSLSKVKSLEPLGKNLYEFWGDKITNKINEINDDYLINLASGEYFDVIKPKKLNKKIITISFKENKNGALKVIGISSKRARGLMTNFVIKNKLTHPEDLKRFNEQNYKFDQSLSDDSHYIFVR